MNSVFKMFKIDAAESERINLADNDPHYHDFEELIIGKEGRLEHFIDFQSRTMDAPFVSFVTQGKMHRVKPLANNGRCTIWVLRFKTEFIAETTFQLYASFHEKANICMNPGRGFDRLDSICGIIYDEYQQPSPDLSVIRQLLSSLFTMIESERGKLNLNNDESRKIQSVTFRNFLTLLEEHYKEPRDVGFYADRLFMSVRNLNLTCQMILHQSVSEIIETRKLTEAKNMLLNTAMPVADIGYELGFKEKTYFTHAFKKKSGMTPTEFREEIQRIIS